jgi:hypothetical protein
MTAQDVSAGEVLPAVSITFNPKFDFAAEEWSLDIDAHAPTGWFFVNVLWHAKITVNGGASTHHGDDQMVGCFMQQGIPIFFHCDDTEWSKDVPILHVEEPTDKSWTSSIFGSVLFSWSMAFINPDGFTASSTSGTDQAFVGFAAHKAGL